MAGRLILAATPIGNLGDASPRLGEAIAGADHVFAEDTRRASILLRYLGITRPTRSYFAGNEAARHDDLAELLRSGASVVLLTDAGTPGISDPGLSAVKTALEVGAETLVIPGPSAVTAALALSGLPADRFVFEGFLPRRGKARNERLAELAGEERTVVLFAAPHRLVDDLTDLARECGGRRVVLCRELTKLHEEWLTGTVAEVRAALAAKSEILGEFVACFHPRAKPQDAP